MRTFQSTKKPIRRYYISPAGDVVFLSQDSPAEVEDCQCVKDSVAHPLFDPVYYERQLPEPPEGNVSPLVHFMEEGWRRGCNPHPLFSVSFYLETNPDVAAAGYNPFVHYLHHGSAEGRLPHPLFDPTYYLKQRPDALAFHKDALTHYVLHGYREDIAPHPLFDPAYYRRQALDLDAASENPLIHFIEEGWRRGFKPHPLFSTSFYLESNPDVAAAGDNPLVHYLRSGWMEHRSPHPIFDPTHYLKQRPDVLSFGGDPLTHYVLHGHLEDVAPHALFDPGYYRSQLTEIGEHVNPLVHFLHRGHLEKIAPHPLFDPDFYRRQVPEIAETDENPLIHFLIRGHLEDIAPHVLFDPVFYRRQAPGIAQTKVNPIIHFLQEGWRHGYNPHPMFSTSFYLEANQDVAAARQNPLVHYLRYGSAEGRRPNEWFDAAEYRGTLEHFLTVGIRQGRAPTRQGASESLLFRLMCRTLAVGDAARAVSQDRCLMHLDGLDRILSVAGPVHAVGSAAISVAQLRPPLRHVLPPVRVLDGSSCPTVATTLPAQEISCLGDTIAVSGTRLLLNENKLLHDEMCAPNSENYGGKIPFIRAFCAGQAIVHIEMDRRQIEEGVLLSSDYDSNYFHWMIEALPKIELLKDIPDHVPLLISDAVPPAGRTALRRLAKGRRVITLRNFTGYRVKRLYVPSDRSRVLNNYDGLTPIHHDIVIDPGAVEFLRSGLLSPQTKRPKRKLFLGRGQRQRALLNESRLGEALGELGYETIDTEAISLDEQIAMWGNAAEVIAPTGAALTNLIFANHGTRVLILASDHPLTNPYLFCQLGAQLSLQVTFAFCQRAFSMTGRYSLHDDFYSDVESVLAWAAIH